MQKHLFCWLFSMFLATTPAHNKVQVLKIENMDVYSYPSHKGSSVIAYTAFSSPVSQIIPLL